MASNWPGKSCRNFTMRLRFPGMTLRPMGLSTICLNAPSDFIGTDLPMRPEYLISFRAGSDLACAYRYSCNAPPSTKVSQIDGFTSERYVPPLLTRSWKASYTKNLVYLLHSPAKIYKQNFGGRLFLSLPTFTHEKSRLQAAFH